MRRLAGSLALLSLSLSLSFACSADEQSAPALVPEGGQGGGPGGSGSVGEGGDGAPNAAGGSSPSAQPVMGQSAGPCTPERTCDARAQCGKQNVCLPVLSLLPKEVVATVPPPDAGDVPPGAPIVLFFKGSYPTQSFAITLAFGGKSQDITEHVFISRLQSFAGDDIYILAPKANLPEGSLLLVRMGFPIVGQLSFAMSRNTPDAADQNLGFELPVAEEEEPKAALLEGVTRLSAGWSGLGDVGIATMPLGSTSASDGAHFAVLTTGNAIGPGAAGGKTSMLVSGPIEAPNAAELRFDFAFLSSEFDEFCSERHDDTLLLVVRGPNGADAVVLDSVAARCALGTQQPASFPGMPDMGDAAFKGSGPQSRGLSIVLGSPVVVSVVLTDVVDERFSSVATFDAVRITPKLD